MLPGKQYAPEDILKVCAARIWVLLLPWAVVSAGVAVYARALPDIYHADTIIRVVPPRVSEEIVRPTVTARLDDRLQSIATQIMSRSQLEKIIQDFDLYAKERRRGDIMEDVVERMRYQDIKITPIKGEMFQVAYEGPNPRAVKSVTEQLATLFINANLKDRTNLADVANNFIDSELEDKKRQLQEVERRLEEYKRRYSGQLPSQVDANLQVLQSSQSQVQNLAESENRDRDRRLLIERQIADLEQQAGDSGPSSSGTPSAAFERLAAARAELASQEAKRHKAGHPDYDRALRRVQQLEAAEASATANPPADPSEPAATPGPRRATDRQRSLDNLHVELQKLDRDIAAKQKEQERLQGVIAAYRSRVEAVPTRESELTELTRDYTTLQAEYGRLSSQKGESKMAANLERREIGEQFSVIDAARVPERPIRPNRPRTIILGILAGLAVGGAFVALLEYRDKSFATDEEVVRVLAVPVLAIVPFMESAAEKKRSIRIRVATRLTFGTTILACIAVVVYSIVH